MWCITPLAAELVRQGHRVDVVTMAFDDLSALEETNGLRIIRTPARRKRSDICTTPEMTSYLLGAALPVRRLMRQNRIDIVHAHFMIPTGPLALLAGHWGRCPVMVTSHGSDVPGHNPQRFVRTHRLLLPFWKRLAGRFDAVVCPSAALGRSIHRHRPDVPVQIIPNGIDTAAANSASAPSDRPKRILLCSRLLEFKGFQYAIEAFGRLQDRFSDWHMDIIGDGPYRDELETCANHFNVPVTFHGWIERSNPKFASLFADSAVFVFPSAMENFPTVLLEAMTAGLAIITSRAGGCPEVVGDAAVFVEPANVESLTDAMAQLMADSGARTALGTAAMQRAEDFRWDHIAGAMSISIDRSSIPGGAHHEPLLLCHHRRRTRLPDQLASQRSIALRQYHPGHQHVFNSPV